MGQQQILLVILVTVITGIASIIALNVFSSNSDSQNDTAVRQDVVNLASAAQAWFMRPIMSGGGGNSFDHFNFNEIAFPGGTISQDGKTITNLNGVYVVENSNSSTLIVNAYPKYVSPPSSGGNGSNNGGGSNPVPVRPTRPNHPNPGIGNGNGNGNGNNSSNNSEPRFIGTVTRTSVLISEP